MKCRDFVLNASVSAEKKRESEGEATRVTVQSRERLKNFMTNCLQLYQSVLSGWCDFERGGGYRVVML